MTITREDQGRIRRGKLSGSMAKDLMSGNYKTWNRLLRDMRHPKPFYDIGPNTPPPLRWGKDHEDQACAIWWERHPRFELENPVILNYHDATNRLWFQNACVSPDRMITEPGAAPWISGFELKCPYVQEIHWTYRTNGVVPPEYYPQCAFGQLVSNVRHWVFCSFDPRLEDPKDQLFEVDVPYDQNYIDSMYEKGTALLEKFELGEDFHPPARTAKRFEEMFK